MREEVTPLEEEKKEVQKAAKEREHAAVNCQRPMATCCLQHTVQGPREVVRRIIKQHGRATGAIACRAAPPNHAVNVCPGVVKAHDEGRGKSVFVSQCPF